MELISETTASQALPRQLTRWKPNEDARAVPEDAEADMDLVKQLGKVTAKDVKVMLKGSLRIGSR